MKSGLWSLAYKLNLQRLTEPFYWYFKQFFLFSASRNLKKMKNEKYEKKMKIRLFWWFLLKTLHLEQRYLKMDLTIGFPFEFTSNMGPYQKIGIIFLKKMTLFWQRTSITFFYQNWLFLVIFFQKNDFTFLVRTHI